MAKIMFTSSKSVTEFIVEASELRSWNSRDRCSLTVTEDLLSLLDVFEDPNNEIDENYQLITWINPGDKVEFATATSGYTYTHVDNNTWVYTGAYNAFMCHELLPNFKDYTVIGVESSYGYFDSLSEYEEARAKVEALKANAEARAYKQPGGFNCKSYQSILDRLMHEFKKDNSYDEYELFPKLGRMRPSLTF